MKKLLPTDTLKKDKKESLKSKCLIWTYEKTGHTTWTLNIKIKIRVTCLYKTNIIS